MKRTEESGKVPRSGTVIVCRHERGCCEWPTHARLLIGTHASMGLGSMTFSKEALHVSMTTLVTSGDLQHDAIRGINLAIQGIPDFPQALHRGDRIVRASADEATANYYLGLIFGGQPTEEGSAGTRYETCTTGACSLNRCADLPKHGLLYLARRTDPIATVGFSKTGVLKKVNRYTDAGLYTDAERVTLIEQIERANLGDDALLRRAEQMASGALLECIQEQIELLFELRRPQPGSGRARFEIQPKEAGQVCGYLFVAGRKEHWSWARSMTRAKQELSTAIAGGVIAEDDQERIMAEITMSGLQESDPSSDQSSGIGRFFLIPSFA